MTKWILDEENNLIHEDDDRRTIICNFPCTLKNESMRADALKIVAVPELIEVIRELLQEAVILSADYLETFRDWPMDATIQGWEKARWIRALNAAQKGEAIIDRITGA